MSLYLMVTFYTIAGLNHFINPEFYYPLIPPYFTYKWGINILSGFLEIAFAALLLLANYRKLAVYGIIFMLIAFIPAHIYFISIGSCIEGGLCVPQWIGWGRLLLIHPLLIFWAYIHR